MTILRAEDPACDWKLPKQLAELEEKDKIFEKIVGRYRRPIELLMLLNFARSTMLCRLICPNLIFLKCERSDALK